MWNKRREEEVPKPFSPPRSQQPSPAGAPFTAAPSSPEPKKEATPLSSMPVGRFEPEARGGAASIGKAVKIVGQIHSREDLYVDGEIEGTVEALEHKITIGPNGNVRAAVKAREVVALGSIHGNVEATDKLEIRKDAKLVGDIHTARIIIEDGAYFKGSIDIVKPEPAKTAPKPQQAAAAAPSYPPQQPAPAAVEVKR